MKGSAGPQRSALEGAWVLNTRSPRQAGELDVLLKSRGAHPLAYPCIDIAPPLDIAPLDAALRELAAGGYDWLVFTSANALDAVKRRMKDLSIPVGQMSRTRVATVGSATAKALSERLGLVADLYPEEYLAEELAGMLVARGARKVLVPQAERAREAVAGVLRANDVVVETVTAYRTVRGSGGVDAPGLLRRGQVDAVIFASPSAVDNMAVRLGLEGGDWEDVKKVCVACIGPVTAGAAERRGLEVSVVAGEHTLWDLVGSLERFFGNRERQGVT